MGRFLLTSSDVTPWLPERCCRCGEKILRSKQGFGCSYAGTGTVARPVPTVWHLPVCLEPPRVTDNG